MLVLAADEDVMTAYVEAAAEAGTPPGRIGVIAMGDVSTPEGASRILKADNNDDYARGLYDALRRADSDGMVLIVAVVPPADSYGVGQAIADRLHRAAAPR
jgi:L-threonylcarbamoyladenylate synthase